MIFFSLSHSLPRSYHVLAVASSKDINIIQAVPTGYVINMQAQYYIDG